MGNKIVGNLITAINEEKKKVARYGMPVAEYEVFCRNKQKRIDLFKERGLISEQDAEMLANLMKIESDDEA